MVINESSNGPLLTRISFLTEVGFLAEKRKLRNAPQEYNPGLLQSRLTRKCKSGRGEATRTEISISTGISIELPRPYANIE